MVPPPTSPPPRPGGTPAKILVLIDGSDNIVASGALAAVTASSALAATPILVSGKYAGQASTQVNGNTVTIAATGAGKSTILGAGKITGSGSGDSSQQPCVPFGGGLSVNHLCTSRCEPLTNCVPPQRGPTSPKSACVRTPAGGTSALK